LGSPQQRNPPLGDFLTIKLGGVPRTGGSRSYNNWSPQTVESKDVCSRAIGISSRRIRLCNISSRWWRVSGTSSGVYPEVRAWNKIQDTCTRTITRMYTDTLQYTHYICAYTDKVGRCTGRQKRHKHTPESSCSRAEDMGDRGPSRAPSQASSLGSKQRMVDHLKQQKAEFEQVPSPASFAM